MFRYAWTQKLTKCVRDLVDDTKQVHVLAADLGGGLLVVVVLLVHVLLVAWSGEEGHVDVKVIGHLNGAHELSLYRFQISVSYQMSHTNKITQLENDRTS